MIHSVLARRFRTGSGGRSVLIIVLGSVASQLIVLITAPLVTRVFSSSEIGAYGLILTAESIFAAVLCLRYEVAVVSEPDEERVAALVKLCLCIAGFIVPLVTLGYFFYLRSTTGELGFAAWAAVFILVSLWISSITRILDAFNNRVRAYGVMTSMSVYRAAIQNFGAVILGLIHFGFYPLLLSHAAGGAVGLSRQARPFKGRWKDVKAVRQEDLLHAMARHKRLAIYSAPAAFISSFSYASLFLAVQFMYGLETAGYYLISFKVLGLPISILSNNVAKVFLERASREWGKTGEFARTLRATLIPMTLVAIPVCLFLIIAAPTLSAFAFGSDWRVAGVYIAILAPMFALRLVVNAVAPALQVAGRQGYELVFQCLFMLASAIAFGAAFSLNSSPETYFLYVTISFSVAYCAFLLLILKSSRRWSLGVR